jgi:hypothetical protein
VCSSDLTWINGKPIYRKAFPDTTVLGTAGTLAPKGNKSFAMSTLIPDIETITNQYILIRITNICDFNPIGTIGITAANTIRTDSAWTALYTGNTGASSAIYITNARDIAFTDNDVYIFGWVEYTKKTD